MTMKRRAGLYEKLLDREFLKFAHKEASRGKSHYREVKMVNSDIDGYIDKIYQSLADGTYKTSEYKIVEKHDGRKLRTIHKLPYYPDRIVQNAIILVCGKMWQNSLIRDTFQSIPSRGTSDARRRISKAMKQKPKYAIKFDINKFYPSVDNSVMKSVLAKKIKDKRMLSLLNEIVDSSRGLPIGNYTSQFFGNLYLSSLDWMVKQELRIKHYYRYCDDIILMHDSKDYLWNSFQKIKSHLDSIKLTVKSNWQLFDIAKEGIDFCGYRFYHTHTLLRSTIKKRFIKKIVQISVRWKSMSQSRIVNSVMAYWGWVKSCDAKNLWRMAIDYKIEAIFRKVYPKKQILPKL